MAWLSLLPATLGCQKELHEPLPFDGCTGESEKLRSSPDEEVRWDAASRLEGCTGEQEALALLYAIQNDKSDEVQRSAARSLSTYPTSLKYLRPHLLSKDATERYLAVVALSVPPPSDLDFLLDDPDVDVRVTYGFKLQGYRPKALAEAAARERNLEARRSLLRYSKGGKPNYRKRSMGYILNRERKSFVDGPVSEPR